MDRLLGHASTELLCVVDYFNGLFRVVLAVLLGETLPSKMDSGSIQPPVGVPGLDTVHLAQAVSHQVLFLPLFWLLNFTVPIGSGVTNMAVLQP